MQNQNSEIERGVQAGILHSEFCISRRPHAFTVGAPYCHPAALSAVRRHLLRAAAVGRGDAGVPRGVDVDRDGNVYFVERTRPRIFSFLRIRRRYIACGTTSPDCPDEHQDRYRLKRSTPRADDNTSVSPDNVTELSPLSKVV
jgi:hypothetical protein